MTPLRTWHSRLTLCGISLFAAASLAQAPPHLTLQDLLSAEPVTETALSPDGTTFALVRSGQIALLPRSGGWPTTLTSAGAGKSGISWSPDGKRLAFASQGDIWAVSVDGGSPQRLTSAPPGSGDPRQATDRDPRWSPDGHWILFTSGRRGINGLLVVSSDGNTTSFLTPASEEAAEGRWSPDGHRILFVGRADSYFSGRLEVLSFDPHSGAQPGTPTVLYTAPIDRGGGWSIRGAEWSPDGRSAVTVLQNDGWNHLYLLPTSGGDPKQLTTGSAEDSDPQFSPDGKTIAFTSNHGLPESTNLWTVPVHGGAPRQIATFTTPGTTSDLAWSPKGDTLFFHHGSSTEATDLFSVSSAGGFHDPVALTHTTPQTLAHAFQEPERVTWKSGDGQEIDGLLYKPRTFKASSKPPAVLWVHGGPEGQDTFHLDGWAQYLAQQGYVVLEPNYRGSSGFGEVFRNRNVQDSNGGEVDDVAAGARFLISNENVDPARIGIGGGSHGGTMVAYAVTRYPELFAAAEELYGVVDRELFVYRTNPQSATRWMMKMGGKPSDKPEVYRRANVLLSVSKVMTPLLVMHGENDPQVPPAESEAFVRALRKQGKTVFYFTYPGELHGFAQPAHRLDAWGKQLAFFDRYLKPTFGTTSTSVQEVVFPENSSKEGQATSHPTRQE